MNNPYEKRGDSEEDFSFEIEGKKYFVEIGKTEAAEGTKYRIGIFDQPDFTKLPIVDHSSLTSEEANEMMDFLKTITSEGLSIDEIDKQFAGHAIDKHNERNKDKEF